MATKPRETFGKDMNLDNNTLTLKLSDLTSTSRLAEVFSRRVKPGQFLALCGELGAGKTTFTRSLTEFLGCRKLATSPTFSLFQHYEGGRLPVFHADLYRVGSDDELFDLGWDEHLEDYRNGLVVVEWADKFLDSWPPDALECQAQYGKGEEERCFNLRATGPQSEKLMSSLEQDWKSI